MRYDWGMSSPVETAVDTYIRVWGERDPARRAALIEACFGQQTRSELRVISAIDAQRTTFRFRGVVERKDGTSPESFDAGEVDANGRISVLLTFAGQLGDPEFETAKI